MDSDRERKVGMVTAKVASLTANAQGIKSHLAEMEGGPSPNSPDGEPGAMRGLSGLQAIRHIVWDASWHIQVVRPSSNSLLFL